MQQPQKKPPKTRIGRFAIGFVVLVVGALAYFTSARTFAAAQAPQAPASGQAAIRVLTFNTESALGLTGGPDRSTTCPVDLLSYSFDKTRFIARYIKTNNIAVSGLQEINARCDNVPLKKDSLNRTVPDLKDGQIEFIQSYKQDFKTKYEKTVGRTFTDASFEQELTRVLGKKTFEDVWVRFLPFDESFWIAMQLIYAENYPVETIAKPYAKDTQYFRAPIYSRLPLSRAVTSDDFEPIIIDQEGTGKDTRWVPRAPLDTPFGPLNFYNTHTRAGKESCEGTKDTFKFAQSTYAADKNLYVLTGDFNQALQNRECDSSIRERYHLVEWGERTAVDYIVSLKALPISPDLASKKVLWARGGKQQDGATLSDHNGVSVNIVGAKKQTVPPLSKVTLPDYFPHRKEGTFNSPTPVTPRAGSSTAPAGAIPICSSDQAPATSGDACFENFVGDFNAIKGKPNVEGMLLFSPFGDNPDPNFAKHLVPGAMVKQLCGGGSCAGTKVGINPATMYGQAGKQHPATYGFDWFLQIADRGNVGATVSTINALPANTKAIIRIGIQGNGTGFNGDPQVYLAFLREVYAGLSAEKKATTYVIAGPNEPDIEWDWFAPSCNQGLNDAFYACIGPKLSSYMNAIIAGNPGFKLLSPTFNMTSFSLNGIFSSMNSSGANWGGLTAISGNLYPAQVPMTQHWQTNGIDALLATAGKPLVITETGPYNCTIVGGAPECINPDQYYIQPINGVNSITETTLTAGSRIGDPKNFQTNIIRDELIMQGYEARCAAPGFRIKLTENGRGAMEKLFLQPEPRFNSVVVGGGGAHGVGSRTDSTAKVYSRLDVDYRDILLPLYRDLDRAEPQLKRSIEDFFGYKDVNGDSYPSVELRSSAVNSLLSSIQRCTVAYQNLLAQDTMCKKLEDPSLCALYATTIPNTAYTIQSLFEAFETARGSRTALEFCPEVMGATEGPNAPLRLGMANAPLTIEKAYRLAFMVTSIRLRVPNPSKLLNLFTHPLGGWMGPPKPRHAVVVVAFKVPDLLTNKGFNDGATIDTAYEDVATLTKNSLITKPVQASIAAEAKDRRTRLLTKGRDISNKVLEDDAQEILCIGGAGVSGVASPQCKDPLSKALVDIINAQALLARDQASEAGTGFTDLLDDYEDDFELQCDSQFETALSINDPGEINAPNDPSHVFSKNWGAALLANLFEDCTHEGTGGGSASFASTQDPTTGACTGEDWFLKSKFFVVEGMLAGNSSKDALAVKHFFVYPSGYELRTVESVLASSFFTKQQLADVLELQSNNPSATEKIVDQFRMEGDKISFNGGEGGYSYTDVVDCPTITKTGIDASGNTYTYEVQQCPVREFGFQLIAGAAKSANILGGTLGYWMRKVQLTLNATTQKSFAYLKTCASLEEYLLDQCGGGGATAGIKPPGQSINVPPTTDGGWVGDQCTSSTTLSEIKYTEPTNLPFTGEATYYGSGVFNATLNTRLSGAAGNDFKGNTTVKNCELAGATFEQAKAAAAAIGQEYVGCVAMLRMGDLYFRTAFDQGTPDPNRIRKIWLKNSSGVIHGPFAVIDVAKDIHAPCLYDQGWAVDIDFNSFKRLFNQTGGPDRATVCDDANCSGD